MDSLRAKFTLFNSSGLCCFYSSAVWFSRANLSDSRNLSLLHATTLVNISCKIRLSAISAGPLLHIVHANSFQWWKASVVVTYGCALEGCYCVFIWSVCLLMNVTSTDHLSFQKWSCTKRGFLSNTKHTFLCNLNSADTGFPRGHKIINSELTL